MFPLGLFAFFFPEHRQEGGWFGLLSGLLLYIVHAVFYFRSDHPYQCNSLWR
jgi:hypothetical protein